jgi:plasmid replication initiation protein
MQPNRAIVVQDNELINTPYILTLNEKRLMLMVISKINPMKMPKPNEVFEVCISIREWRDMFGLTSKTLYDDLYAACGRLADRPALRIDKAHSRPAIAPWISYADPEPEHSHIRVTLVYKLLVYLQGFVDQFTQYDLLNVRNLKSFYGIRIYELLCQYKKIGKRTFELADFRALIDPDNKYPRWPDMRRYIIEKSLTEINRETDLTVSWGQTNPGRKVTAITFSIKSKLKLASV